MLRTDLAENRVCCLAKHLPLPHTHTLHTSSLDPNNPTIPLPGMLATREILLLLLLSVLFPKPPSSARPPISFTVRAPANACSSSARYFGLSFALSTTHHRPRGTGARESQRRSTPRRYLPTVPLGTVVLWPVSRYRPCGHPVTHILHAHPPSVRYMYLCVGAKGSLSYAMKQKDKHPPSRTHTTRTPPPHTPIRQRRLLLQHTLPPSLTQFLCTRLVLAPPPLSSRWH